MSRSFEEIVAAILAGEEISPDDAVAEVAEHDRTCWWCRSRHEVAQL